MGRRCQVTPSDQAERLSEMFCVQTRSFISWLVLATSTYTTNTFREVSTQSNQMTWLLGGICIWEAYWLVAAWGILKSGFEIYFQKKIYRRMTFVALNVSRSEIVCGSVAN